MRAFLPSLPPPPPILFSKMLPTTAGPSPGTETGAEYARPLLRALVLNTTQSEQNYARKSWGNSGVFFLLRAKIRSGLCTGGAAVVHARSCSRCLNV